MEDLQPIRSRKSKRVGRGYGSGKGGHTAGRGSKGQKSRSSVHILFEGLKTRKSLLNRIPFRRGKNKFKSKPKPIAISLNQLEKLPDTVIDKKVLLENGFITKGDLRRFGVKVLSNGKLTKKLIVNLPASKSAKDKIEKAGGKVQ